MIFDINGSVKADDKVRRYVGKVLDSLERYLAKSARGTAEANIRLERVDRPHGNKYEAVIRLKAGGRTYEAADSTLNVYAALDIVRLKLARALEKDAPGRLPKA